MGRLVCSAPREYRLKSANKRDFSFFTVRWGKRRPFEESARRQCQGVRVTVTAHQPAAPATLMLLLLFVLLGPAEVVQPEEVHRHSAYTTCISPEGHTPSRGTSSKAQEACRWCADQACTRSGVERSVHGGRDLHATATKRKEDKEDEYVTGLRDCAWVDFGTRLTSPRRCDMQSSRPLQASANLSEYIKLGCRSRSEASFRALACLDSGEAAIAKNAKFKLRRVGLLTTDK
ncbi:hypothetical protein GEV33_010838 [Tenebrio molitor]|uniref:Uncharacterized protein n=1 Tax=Tenebrio molitor TaxID=7067 RepID=A0A8J6L8M6_TENMO|nr:hypothetical protein GEV33_010838 [Tenebrio molitor]